MARYGRLLTDAQWEKIRPLPVYGSTAPLQSTPPWLTVRMELDGVSIRLLLDTAASGIILFQSRIRNRLQLVDEGERVSSNLGGQVRLQRVILAGTKFGETDFGQRDAFVVNDQEDESRDFDGLFAPSALGLKQIAFDFKRHTLSWENTSSAPPVDSANRTLASKSR